MVRARQRRQWQGVEGDGEVQASLGTSGWDAGAVVVEWDRAVDVTQARPGSVGRNVLQGLF